MIFETIFSRVKFFDLRVKLGDNFWCMKIFDARAGDEKLNVCKLSHEHAYM